MLHWSTKYVLRKVLFSGIYIIKSSGSRIAIIFHNLQQYVGCSSPSLNENSNYITVEHGTDASINLSPGTFAMCLIL